MKNLSLTAKFAVLFVPLFLAAAAAAVYLQYSTTQEQMMWQVQNAATAQANTIKEALVNMMVTNESIDDNYLRKVSSSGDIKDIRILFRMDSLHFDESYLEDDVRRTRLIRREVEVWDANKDFGGEVFFTKEPKWFLTCTKHLHPTKPIANLAADKPAVLNECDEMKALIPFVAEKKCTKCHNVAMGNVIGAAVMSVPLAQTAEHLQSSALRTVGLFGGFLGVTLLLTGLMNRSAVAARIRRLVNAAGTIGSGATPQDLSSEAGKDEIGTLAAALESMRTSLERVRNEQGRLERMGTAGSMAAAIVHDLRTPMTTVSLVADFLARHETMSPEDRTKKLEQLHSAVRKIDDRLQDLLDFSSPVLSLNTGAVTGDELAEGIAADHEEHFSKSTIRFAVSNRSNGSTVLDKERVRRAVAALVDNAEDAMPAGGMLSVVLSDSNDSLRISIEDTGGGVPESIRGSLFDPFVTYGKRNHAGLGLSIAKKITDAHHGILSFTTEPGKRTEFVITIPRSRGAA